MQSAADMITSISRSKVPYWLYSKVMFAIQPYRDDTFEATEIMKYLWVGDLRSGCSTLESFKERDIQLVVSAVYGCSARFPFEMNYVKANLLDKNGEDISDDIERIIPIIDNYISSGKSVLIHCMAGKSRSVTIAAAYLMKYQNMNANEALEFIRDKRSFIDPNQGYLNQLNIFEEKLRMEYEEYLAESEAKLELFGEE